MACPWAKWVSSLWPATCGERTTLDRRRSGLSCGRGSSAKTSSAALIRPPESSRRRAASSTRAPRPALMRTAPSRKLDSSSGPITPRVSGSSGAWRETTSARRKSSSRLTSSAPRLSAAARSRYGSATRIAQSKARSNRITSRPTRPAPQTPTTWPPSRWRGTDSRIVSHSPPRIRASITCRPCRLSSAWATTCSATASAITAAAWLTRTPRSRTSAGSRKRTLPAVWATSLSSGRPARSSSVKRGVPQPVRQAAAPPRSLGSSSARGSGPAGMWTSARAASLAVASAESTRSRQRLGIRTVTQARVTAASLARLHGALTEHELGCQMFGADARGPRLQGERQCTSAHLGHGDANGRQGGHQVAGDRDVVEARDRNVPRDVDAVLAEPAHRADGHDVVQGEDGGKVRDAFDKDLDGPLTAVTREVAVDEGVVGESEARLLQAHAEAGQPVVGGRQVGRPGDHADPAVAQVGQRPGQAPGRADVVGHRGVTAGVVPADQGGPAACGLEARDLGSHPRAEFSVLEVTAGHHHGLHPQRPEVSHVGQLALWVAVRVADEKHPLRVGRRPQHSPHDLPEIGITDVVDDDADGPVAGPGEGSGVEVGCVAELARSREDPGAQRRADRADAVQLPRSGRHRDAGQPCHVPYGRCAFHRCRHHGKRFLSARRLDQLTGASPDDTLWQPEPTIGKALTDHPCSRQGGVKWSA